MSDTTTAYHRFQQDFRELFEEYRAQVLAEAAAALPPWEAVYDSATFTPRLLAYCQDEATARGAAEAWLRAHCEDAAGLQWTPDPVMAGGDWDQWLSLSRLDDGTVLDTEIVVRRRAAPTV